MIRSLFTLFVMILLAASPEAQADVSLELDKPTVEIGTFYNGTSVLCQGTVPLNTDVVIRVSGQPEELHLKKKGKVAGLLWMNVGDFTFSNAPKVYMLYSSAGSKKTIDNPAMIYSYAALADRIEIDSAGAEKEKWFNEFLKLKKHNKTYAEFPGAVTTSVGKDNSGHFAANLVIPPLMGQDDYQVTVYAIENGTIIGQAEKVLTIRQVGFPKKLTDLAYNHALIYGVFSVLVALAAGLLMGVLFKGKGGAH